jgi:hypothetical protein
VHLVPAGKKRKRNGDGRNVVRIDLEAKKKRN